MCRYGFKGVTLPAIQEVSLLKLSKMHRENTKKEVDGNDREEDGADLVYWQLGA